MARRKLEFEADVHVSHVVHPWKRARETMVQPVLLPTLATVTQAWQHDNNGRDEDGHDEDEDEDDVSWRELRFRYPCQWLLDRELRQAEEQAAEDDPVEAECHTPSECEDGSSSSSSGSLSPSSLSTKLPLPCRPRMAPRYMFLDDGIVDFCNQLIKPEFCVPLVSQVPVTLLNQVRQLVEPGPAAADAEPALAALAALALSAFKFPAQ